MQRRNFILGSFVLGSTLLVGMGVRAHAQPDKDDKKYYDRAHKDYHSWDTKEDQAYRRWLTEERHEKYRPYSKLHGSDQSKYWQWRHDHH